MTIRRKLMLCLAVVSAAGSVSACAGGVSGNFEGDAQGAPAADLGPPVTPTGPSKSGTCTASEAVAMSIHRPLDVIVLPDESPTMGGKRDAVASAMQTQFLDVMTKNGTDFQVIWNGAWPLPALGAHLYRNPVGLGSGNTAMFKPVLDTYAKWSAWLRPGSVKVFVHFTDATGGNGSVISGYTGTFDQNLQSINPQTWGTSADPRFVYHPFVGLRANTPSSAPYEPSDPLVTQSCSSSFYNPSPLQQMAIRTKGLRFPLCLDGSFGAVFQRIAESAVEQTKLPCTLALPAPPQGQTLDLSTVAMRFTAGSGAHTLFTQVASAAACTPQSFTIEGDHVVLCPDACTAVTGDTSGRLSVLSGCNPADYID